MKKKLRGEETLPRKREHVTETGGTPSGSRGMTTIKQKDGVIWVANCPAVDFNKEKLLGGGEERKKPGKLT